MDAEHREAALLTTRALLTRHRARDPEASRELYERFVPELRRRCAWDPVFRGHPSWQQIDDVVDQVFLEAYETGYFETFDPLKPGKTLAGLQTILTRALVRGLRHDLAQKRGGTTTHVSLDDPGCEHLRPVSTASRDPTPTSAARVRELHDRLRGLLTGLEWELFRSVALDDRRYADLVGRFGPTPEAVRQRFKRVLRKVREDLAPSEA